MPFSISTSDIAKSLEREDDEDERRDDEDEGRDDFDKLRWLGNRGNFKATST